MIKFYSKALALILILAFLSVESKGQNISGIVNSYYRVSAINLSTNSVTVPSSAGLTLGTRVLLIQMKGAAADASNSANFGNITSINNAGNYEFNIICSVVGNDILLQYNLLKTYDTAGLIQLVTVPVYSSVTITDTLKAQPWNVNLGTGGVIAIQASNTITLSAPIDAQGVGFTGGDYIDYLDPPYSCDWTTSIMSYFLANPPAGGASTGGAKGEGINIYPASAGAGRGKIGNGGGGGNNHNTGGGGGSNAGSGGQGGQRTNEGGLIVMDSIQAWEDCL